MIGELLGSRYRIQRRLGGGGSAVVYQAMDTYLDRPVSVKVFRTPAGAEDGFVARFRREATSVASLSHPNIVAIYDLGQEDDTYYLVMEYVEGVTLKERIAAETPLTHEQAVHITLQILDALEHAHEHGIVHRDVKPQNILITADGRVKVTDFGIARGLDGGTLVHTDAIVGSAHYLSPEQARGGPVDERSDLYAVGVVLFEMLAGTVPYDGDTAVTVALKHLNEPVPSARGRNPRVPEGLDHVVRRAMAKDPAHRYASAAEIEKDLRAWLRGEPLPSMTGGAGMDTVEVPAGSVARGIREQGRAMRSRRLLVGGTTVLVLGIAALVGYNLFAAWLRVPTIVVPQVEGASLTEATRLLTDAGLEPRVVGQQYHEMPPSSVVRQTPAAGMEVRRGREVELVMSLGPELQEVPRVIGLHRQEAENQLSLAGFSIDVSPRHDAVTPAGYIVDQDPAPFSRVERGRTVELVESLGPEGPRRVQVPGIVGLSLDNAEQKLREFGLVVGEVREGPSQMPAGVVAEQSPVTGTEAVQGDDVDLVVSSGCQKLSRREVPIGGSRPVELRVELADRQGQRVVHQGTHEPGATVRLEMCWSGDAARMLVYADGQLVQDEVLTD